MTNATVPSPASPVVASAGPLKVSVIIATFRSGDGLQRVIDSLQAQTLPPDQFEVIFVDDGSGDDTPVRLREVVAGRPTWHLFEIPNSGWPSKPRNVGIGQAHGEYLLFMDHDDSLYPDGLRRAYEYAVEVGADVLSLKEGKTTDAFWSTSATRAGNLASAVGSAGAGADGSAARTPLGPPTALLFPMVPHKLYRRSLVLDHQVRFPEGPRQLWEDIDFTISAYRAAETVAVLADTPVYLWHIHGGNTSYSFKSANPDLWQRLEVLFAHIDDTLAGPEFAADRAFVLAHQVKARIVTRLLNLLKRDNPSIDWFVARARELLQRYADEEVLGAMPEMWRALAMLFARGDVEGALALHRFEFANKASVECREPVWDQGVLRFGVDLAWRPSGRRPWVVRKGDRLELALPAEVRSALPSDLVDVTGKERLLSSLLLLHGRAGVTSWRVPVRWSPPRWVEGPAGLELTTQGMAEVDLDSGACGGPFAPDVWDLRFKAEWRGRSTRPAVRYPGPPLPLIADTGTPVAYGNTQGGLSLDLSGAQRTFVVDAARLPVRGTGELDVVLGTDIAAAAGERPVDHLYLGPVDGPVTDEPSVPLTGTLAIADGSARMILTVPTRPGSHAVWARRDDRLQRTRLRLSIGGDGVAELDRAH